MKQAISIVWFKRDLRLTDHEALYEAQHTGLPVLLLYCFEPLLMNYDDSDLRHWRFVWESLQDIALRLKTKNAQLYICHAEVLDVYKVLNDQFDVKYLFSHQEIGNKLTFDRDIAVANFCREHQWNWKEFQTNGIIRKLRSRRDWDRRWKETMTDFPKLVDDTI